jgi:hypothetical protein
MNVFDNNRAGWRSGGWPAAAWWPGVFSGAVLAAALTIAVPSDARSIVEASGESSPGSAPRGGSAAVAFVADLDGRVFSSFPAVAWDTGRDGVWAPFLQRDARQVSDTCAANPAASQGDRWGRPEAGHPRSLRSLAEVVASSEGGELRVGYQYTPGTWTQPLEATIESEKTGEVGGTGGQRPLVFNARTCVAMMVKVFPGESLRVNVGAIVPGGFGVDGARASCVVGLADRRGRLRDLRAACDMINDYDEGVEREGGCHGAKWGPAEDGVYSYAALRLLVGPGLGMDGISPSWPGDAVQGALQRSIGRWARYWSGDPQCTAEFVAAMRDDLPRVLGSQLTEINSGSQPYQTDTTRDAASEPLFVPLLVFAQIEAGLVGSERDQGCGMVTWSACVTGDDTGSSLAPRFGLCRQPGWPSEVVQGAFPAPWGLPGGESPYEER